MKTTRVFQMILYIMFCASLAACAAESPGGEVEEQGGEEVGTAVEAIQVSAWNGTCAQSLSLRTNSDGSGYACGYYMPWGTKVYVWGVSGAWAHITVADGMICGGATGWSLKDDISRNCCPNGNCNP